MSKADGRVVGTTQIVDHGSAALRWNIAIMGDGYRQAELGKYAADVTALVGIFLAAPPFDTLQQGINVFRIDVASKESGAGDPTACGGTGAAPRTFFNATFCNNGIRRLLVVNDKTALATAAAQVPAFHLAIVLVNSTIYGGSGGSVAVLSLAPGAAEIALHETGHTAFGLADEYQYYAGCGVDAPGTHDRHPAGEPSQPNVTLDADRATIKWHGLVLGTTPMPTMSNPNCGQCDDRPSPAAPGIVGAFEGAHYYHCGAFRPSFDCRMRALGFPFCAVCQDVIRRTLAPFMPGAHG
jgi:IgA peptidase M64